MSRGRAFRRYKRQLKKNQVRKWMKMWGWPVNERSVGFVASSPKTCSCQMCCNPRRSHWDKSPETMQEKRSEYSFNEAVKEYFELQ